MTRKWKTILLSMILLLWNLPGFTQIVRTISIEGEMFRIAELSVMLSEDGENTVKVAMAMPKDMRREPYRGVDIQEGDVILYLNGKRIRKVKAFEEQYAELEIGAKVQIGIKRDKDPFIISFDKADPKDLPQMQMTGSGSGEGGHSPGVQRMMLTPEDMGGYENLKPVLGLAVILGEEEEMVKVARVLPLPGMDKNELKDGDIIQALNGQKVKSTQQFEEIYKKVEVGDKLDIELSRDGHKLSVSVVKPKARGNIIIRQD